MIWSLHRRSGPHPHFIFRPNRKKWWQSTSLTVCFFNWALFVTWGER